MKYSYLSIDNNIIEDSLKSSLSNCKNLSTKVKTDDKLSCLSKAILMDKIEFVEYKSENESNNSQEELTLKLPKIKNGQTSNEPTNSNQSKDKLFEKYLIKNEWTLQTSQITALRNMGNTCYVNSTLQCLIYTPSLLNYLNIYHAQNCNRPRGKCICCDLYQLIRVCLYGNYNKMTKIISPSQFIAKLKSVAPNFRSHQQQDAHEYLRQLIDKLRICSIPLDKINRHLSKSEIRDISETTAINCIFGGVYDSIVTCKNCNLSSNTKDNFMDLTVDIKDRNIFTIEDALKQLIKPEVLAGQNGYYCSK
ncbi:putative ubiquitin carboxyl-terminal hydrolase 17-like protein 23 [Intoshia linei]|uniref:Ubiquitin carboxyl-terminal hydrolase 36 n=1 Tax=Intoshia linei TaxID=1819745 RepID=A0A177B063_9BILA|nr:putative ubiquitin carboxyl-terminal hydrolase 17-like protein 23 [Intoshia linei]